MTTLPVQQVEQAGLADWRQLWSRLAARFRTGDFATGAALLARIAEAAEQADHHPDLDLRYAYLDVRLVSHDAGGITERDVELARTVSALAAEAGATADVDSLRFVELGLDTADAAAVRPFWAAVLGLSGGDGEAADADLVDPGDAVPHLWFQPTEAHPTPRQRFHPDVWVPADQAEAGVAAAVAAGGTLVTDEFAPAFWVLADAQGNQVCLCTPLERD